MSQTDCYCVCHSPVSSNAWCEHCKGDNEVGRYHRKRNELRDAVVEAAKAWRQDWLMNARQLRLAINALLQFEQEQNK